MRALLTGITGIILGGAIGWIAANSNRGEADFGKRAAQKALAGETAGAGSRSHSQDGEMGSAERESEDAEDDSWKGTANISRAS